MLVPPVAYFLETLRQLQLMPLARLEELAQRSHAFATPQDLGREAVQRGLLTAFQVDIVLQERLRELFYGPYLLIDRLGEDSRGEVFKARHLKMDRMVILKVIRKELLADPQAVQRFYEEVELASQLAHPNVVHAYDAGPIGPTHFLAMEYVEGTDLGQRVRDKGPLPWRQACTYIAQAALGLQHAFERGLLHRDIRPDSLFVTVPRPGEPQYTGWGPWKKPIPEPESKSWGTVKITGFGQGRLLLGPDADVAQTPTPLGRDSLDYLAPEVLHGQVDVRADIYGLGCSFWFLLTGRPPCPGGPLVDGKPRQAEAIEPLCPELPAAAAAVLRRLMAPVPADRYQTPAEAAVELAAAANCALGPTPVAASIPAAEPVAPEANPELAQQRRRARARRRQWLLIGGSSAALVAGVWFLAQLIAERMPQPQPPPEAAATNEAPATVELRRLLEQIRSQPGGEEHWPALLTFIARYPGTPEEKTARERLRVVPSPMDRLNRDQIPEAERYNAQSWAQPKELVAVLGEHRWRQWGTAPRYLAYSPDGQLLASAANDSPLVHIWDTATGRLRFLLRKHERPVRALAFSPKGTVLASASMDKNVILWDTAKGASQTVLTGHGAEVLAVAFAPTGETLASAGNDRQVHLWDVARRAGKDAAFPSGHGKPIHALAFAPDGRTLATGSEGGQVKLWDVEEKKARATINAHPPGVTVLAFAPRGWSLASGGRDNAIRFWSEEGKEERVFNQHTKPIHSLAFAPDGQTLYSTSEDRTVRFWDLNAGSETHRLTSQTGTPFGVAPSPDGKLLAIGAAARDPAIQFWDLANNRQVELSGPTAAPQSFTFAPDGRTLVLGGPGPTLHLWDLITGRERLALDRITHLDDLAVLPEGQVVVGASRRQASLQLWDSATGKSKTTYKLAAPALGLFVSPDGRTLAALCTDQAIRLLDSSSGKEAGVLKGINPRPGVDFSPDGQLLATGFSDEHTVALWDLADQKPRATLRRLEQPITAVAFSRDGSLLATACQDRAVHLWDVAAGKERSEWLVRHTGLPAAVVFAPNGQGISSDDEGQILIWKPGSRETPRLIQMPGAVHGMLLAPDGRHLAVFNGNGTIYLLRLWLAGPRS